MRLLDELELLTEEKDSYKLYPVDYDAESGVSFGVDLVDDDETVAKITIKTIDGVPIDALNGNYDYDDVYADVSIEGDNDDPKNADLMLWVLKKIKNMGYDEQSIRIDGDEYYKKPETLSHDANDEGEHIQSDTEFDPSSYWKSDTENDTDSDDEYSSVPGDTDEESDDDSSTEDESDDDSEDTESSKSSETDVPSDEDENDEDDEEKKAKEQEEERKKLLKKVTF